MNLADRLPAAVRMAALARVRSYASSPIVPLIAILLVLGMQLTLVFGRAINWDEFYHYSRVEMLAKGTLSLPLQTLYTRAFVWVVDLPGTGVDHIVLIRVFMFLCEIVTLVAIVGMATRFSNRTAALLSALSYVSAGFVFQHGFSFRFDPPTAAMLMLALWILLSSRLDGKAIVTTGLLIGLSFMMTIKAVLYAPAFAGILWMRWNENGRTAEYLVRIVLTGICAVAAFSLIYLLHSQGLDSHANDEARTVVTQSVNKMFGIGYQPYWPVIIDAAIIAPILTICILIFPIKITKFDLLSYEIIAITGLFFTVTTLIFYHNTAAYYYTFMLAPVVVACSPVFAMLARRYGLVAVSLILLFFAGMVRAAEPESPIDKQRKLLLAAQMMFPEPVAYFDFCAMLGNFPKANAFMTPWGREMYKRGVFPTMRRVMSEQAVPLVLVDDPMFFDVFWSRRDVPEFLPDDVEAMRSTYIQLWGPFWIAGKLIPANSPHYQFELLVPGPYTVYGSAVNIDGTNLRPGDLIELKRGEHLAWTGDKEVRLVWGRNIQTPDAPPPSGSYFTPGD